MSAARCPKCQFEVWLPIVAMRTSTLGLYDDARFPGRCILVYNKHVEDIDELAPEDSCQFLEDARTAAAAIKRVTDSPRINLAILGNTVPHLHWHLIPRQPMHEPRPTRPPWEHPNRVASLATKRASELVALIRQDLVNVQ